MTVIIRVIEWWGYYLDSIMHHDVETIIKLLDAVE